MQKDLLTWSYPGSWKTYSTYLIVKTLGILTNTEKNKGDLIYLNPVTEKNLEFILYVLLQRIHNTNG